MDFSWTDEAIADLRRYKADHYSASDIAFELNRSHDASLSRCAVLGKIKRLGLSGPKRVAAPKKPPHARVTFTPRLRRTATAMREPGPLPFTGDPREIAPEQRRSLLGLTNETCRYPYGDPHEPEFFFCGSLTADCRAGRPYCSRHAAVVYSRPAPVGDAERERRAAHGRWLSRLAARKRATA